MTKPYVSIIIRCFNEEKHIGRLLEGILQQSIQDYEIILVDSGSTDKTIEIARRYPVRLLHVAPQDFSFGYALNYGCSRALGEYLVFTSAHCYPVDSEWLMNIICMFEDPRVGLVYGKQRGAESTRYFEHQVFRKLFPENTRPIQEEPFCNNANAAIRRSIWENIPYDEELTGLEDIEWAHRMLHHGFCLAYSAEAEVIHVHEESRNQRYNRYKREAMALKKIFPYSHFNIWDFLWLYCANCFTDVVSASKDGVIFQNWLEILKCRYDQFIGTYHGYCFKGPLDQQIKMQYFYPAGYHQMARTNTEIGANDIKNVHENTKSLRVVALVPMRAESKRVPNKNLRPFNGKPLYFYILRTLQDCDFIDEIVINTDSSTLAEEIPKLFDKARIIRRPERLLGDTVPMNDIILHDVDQVQADWYIQTHATNPLLKEKTIKSAFEALIKSSSHDSLFSVTSTFSRFWDISGNPINHNPKKLLRTQDLDPVLEENSNIYMFNSNVLKKNRNRIGDRPLMFEIPKDEAWDIDDEIDFRIAEFLHLNRINLCS